MNLYLIARKDDGRPHYDEADSFVVAAQTPGKARKYASLDHGDEGADLWLDPKLSSCKKIGTASSTTKPGIINRDFHEA